MNKITKKEISQMVEEAIGKALEKLKISTPSKKTKKLLGKVSKKFSGQLKEEVKKQNKKVEKESKTTKNVLPSKKSKTKAIKIEQA